MNSWDLLGAMSAARRKAGLKAQGLQPGDWGCLTFVFGAPVSSG
jgi:hypothetical protein